MEEKEKVKVLLHRTNFWNEFWKVCDVGVIEDDVVVGCSGPAHVELEVPIDKIRTVAGNRIVDNTTVEMLLTEGHVRASPLLVSP